MTEATAIVGYFFPESMYMFAMKASEFKSKVQIKVNKRTGKKKYKVIDAKSLLMIMSSSLYKGTEITICADGPDEAEAVRQLKEMYGCEDSYELARKYNELKEENARRAERQAEIRAERLERLKQYTTTKKILENVDKVAFDQDELTNLTVGDVIQEIYLCANQFVIPLDRKNKTYVGIGKPVAVIQSNEPVDFDELGIKFKNVAFDDDYQKILRKKTPRAKKSVKATQNKTQEIKPMAKKERFALMMEDGAQVRNIDDLKAHFDVGSVVRDFSSGKLLTWLEDRYYDDEADAIRAINDNDNFLGAKLCKIFGMETPEEIERRFERLNRLKQFTNDEKILSKVDCVAFDQENLADLLDEGVEEIYLCENRFVIPLRMKNKVYIGVGKAIAVIRSKEPVDFTKIHIAFKNVTFDDDYQKILPKTTAKNTQTTTKSKPFRFIDQKPTSLPSKPLSPPVEITTTMKDSTRDKNGYSETETGGSVYVKHCSIFVQKANSFKSKVQIKARGKIVDAKSILMIMSLGLVKGVEITIIAEGEDAKEAVESLKALVDSNFGEE